MDRSNQRLAFCSLFSSGVIRTHESLDFAFRCGSLVFAAALTVCTFSRHRSPPLPSDDSQATSDASSRYTGPPIFLDEPETPPPAALVEKRVDTDKYPNGKIRYERQIAHYSDNHFVADGFYREFYPNGEKFVEGQYKDGRQDGEWTYYHDNGKVQRTVNYTNGQPDGSWEVFNADGTVVAKRGYKDGKRDGTWIVVRRNRQAAAARRSLRGRQGRRHLEGLVPHRSR